MPACLPPISLLGYPRFRFNSTSLPSNRVNRTDNASPQPFLLRISLLPFKFFTFSKQKPSRYRIRPNYSDLYHSLVEISILLRSIRIFFGEKGTRLGGGREGEGKNGRMESMGRSSAQHLRNDGKRSVRCSAYVRVEFEVGSAWMQARRTQ